MAREYTMNDDDVAALYIVRYLSLTPSTLR